jgi:hypothetical protein
VQITSRTSMRCSATSSRAEALDRTRAWCDGAIADRERGAGVSRTRAAPRPWRSPPVRIFLASRATRAERVFVWSIERVRAWPRYEIQ